MIALVAVLAAADCIYMKKVERLENTIEAGYMNAVEELAQNAGQISAVLEKGRYASSPAMMTKLSSSLSEKAAAAKASLESLPVYGMSIDNLEKFLSQVGNYARSLSERATAGEKLSTDDRQNVEKLGECAEKLSSGLWELQAGLLSNDGSITELFSEVDGELGGIVSDGFSGLEDSLSDMPKLIYDGPFSDHILERVPAMTSGAEEITEEEALAKAAAAIGADSFRVHLCDSGEEGRMPAYCFYCEGARCAVSKNGGYVIYCLKSRAVRDSEISPEEGCRRAEEYLKDLGIGGMERTYFETYNNVLTVNFAYREDGVTFYTDLIKVAVALDDGEVIGYDARGFLVNHRDRSFPEPKIGKDEASESVMQGLKVKNVGLAVIPTDAVDEELCYELSCESEQGKEVLIYVSAVTGEERDILILLKSDTGVLTV